jgi:hypothetical protein
MTPVKSKKYWQDELWNVSLLPTTELIPSPPRRPEPPSAGALVKPAVLSICENVAPEPWLLAA